MLDHIRIIFVYHQVITTAMTVYSSVIVDYYAQPRDVHLLNDMRNQNIMLILCLQGIWYAVQSWACSVYIAM